MDKFILLEHWIHQNFPIWLIVCIIIHINHLAKDDLYRTHEHLGCGCGKSNPSPYNQNKQDEFQ
jgi:hypothetical protein